MDDIEPRVTHATDNDAGAARIRLIRRIVLDGGPKSVGSEYVLPWGEALALISSGAAIAVDCDRFGRPVRIEEER